MTRDELIAKLHDARALVYQAHEGTDLPQIQMILRHADQNLHWALWNLGVVNSLRPDLPPEEKKRAAPARKKPARAAAKRGAGKLKARKPAKPKRRSTARGRTKRR